MRALFLLSLVPLAACSSAGEKEEEKYRIAEREADRIPVFKYKTLCPRAQAVAAAYLDDRNEEKYKEWKLTADLNCGLAADPYAR